MSKRYGPAVRFEMEAHELYPTKWWHGGAKRIVDEARRLDYVTTEIHKLQLRAFTPPEMSVQDPATADKIVRAILDEAESKGAKF